MAERPIRVLLVEDDYDIRRAMIRELEDLGFSTIAASSGEEAQRRVPEEDLDVILLDLHLPGINGLTFFRSLKDMDDPPQVIILSGETRFDLAVEALRLGAYDYMVKPPNPDMLNLVVRKASHERQTKRELERLRLLLAHQSRTTSPLGQSPPFLRLLTLAQMAAPTETPVLLLGETGAGKEVIANYLHQISMRHKGPFVPINCAAIPDNLMESELFGHEKGAFTGAQRRKPGYFEMAEGGTLFLDEIGDMDINTQSKLLRVVETGTYFRVGGTKPIRADVRIISATNRALRKEAEAGRFRPDLFYRLQGFDLNIPPLRERVSDIPILVAHFLGLKEEQALPMTDDAMAALQKHAWPGNIRELSHVVEKARILAQGATIDLKHLPLELSGLSLPQDNTPPQITSDTGDVSQVEDAPKSFNLMEMMAEGGWLPLEELERQYICQVLEEQSGHQGRTAKILQISPRTLYRKLRQYES